MMNFSSVTNTNEMDPMCAGLKLSRTQRIYGFAISFVTGFLVSVLSTLFLTVSTEQFILMHSLETRLGSLSFIPLAISYH